MDILALVPLPVRMSWDFFKSQGRRGGRGVAVCQDMLVISYANNLEVFALPEDIVARCHVQHVRTLGGAAPMEFQFWHDSGFIAFTNGCGETTLLLVTDTSKSGSGAIHVVDVVRGAHVGYVAAPGTIMYPRGVATQKSLAAVSCCDLGSSRCTVRVFETSDAATWTAARVIDLYPDSPRFSCPVGLRFAADGARLVVADFYESCVGIFRARDEASLCYIADASPMDVEECGSEWLVCCGSEVVAVVDNAPGAGAVVKRRHLGFYCTALAVVPGLGVVLRHSTGVQVLATPDAIAMAAMSSCKVAWMTAQCRAAIMRRATIARRLTTKQRF